MCVQQGFYRRQVEVFVRKAATYRGLLLRLHGRVEACNCYTFCRMHRCNWQGRRVSGREVMTHTAGEAVEAVTHKHVTGFAEFQETCDG